MKGLPLLAPPATFFAILLMLGGAGQAFAQAPPVAGTPSCVYDQMAASERQDAAGLYIAADTKTPEFKAMAGKMQSLGMACVAANKWDYARGSQSIRYAAYRSIYERIEQANVALGLPAGRLMSAWQALSPDDRDALRDEDDAYLISRQVSERLSAGGVKVTRLREALVALSEIGAIVNGWKRP